MKYNIISIDQMIDLIDDFFNDKMKHVLYVGGMIGTELFRFVTDEAIKHTSFSQMLFIEGCQDFIGLSKTQMPNYLFYPALLVEHLADPLEPYDPFKGKFMNPDKEVYTSIDIRMISGYNLMIIDNAHLIDHALVKDLINTFTGKVIVLADPFDVGGDIYSLYPCIVDTFVKLPVIQGMARHVYGIETMFIDKHKSSVSEIKLQNRSIGKIDDKQYVSNDPDIIEMVREKQYKSGFRKNQKVIVAPENKRKLFSGFGSIGTVLYNNSMMTIDVSQNHPWMSLRIHHSKSYIKCSLTYDRKEDNGVNINVEPANIITVDQYIHHRFKNTVFVYNEDLPLSTAQRYSIIKNTNNLQIVKR